MSYNRSSDTPVSLGSQALDKMDDGDFVGAESLLTTAIQMEPNVDRFVNRGNCRLNLENYKGAAEDYRAALRLDPNDIDCWFSLANSCSLAGDNAAASEAVEKFLELGKSDSRRLHAIFIRATVNTKISKENEAIKDFQYLISQDPTFMDAYEGIIKVFSKMGQSQDVTHWEQMKINGAEIFKLYNQAAEQMQNKRIDEAITTIDRVLALNPDHIPSVSFKGLALSNQNKFKEALPYFEKAEKSNPQDPYYQIDLGRTYAELGNVEKARIHLQKGVEIAPDAQNYINELKRKYKL